MFVLNQIYKNYTTIATYLFFKMERKLQSISLIGDFLIRKYFY